MAGAVVALGARCELVPADAAVASPGSVSFAVDEFAVLADGRRVVLHEGERGFAVSGAWRRRHDHPLGDLTEEDVVAGVLTTVLPDEDDGEPHPWSWLARLLLRHDVTASPEELRALPYRVELGERLRALLGADG